MTLEQYLLRLWYLMFWPLLDPPETLRPPPSMTDLMVSPEAIDECLRENPPPPPMTS